MKKRRAIPLFLSLCMAAALLLSSCSDTPGQIPGTSSSTDGSTSVSASGIIDSAQTDGMDFSFSGRDENTEYDENSATEILFSEAGSRVTGRRSRRNHYRCRDLSCKRRRHRRHTDRKRGQNG